MRKNWAAQTSGFEIISLSARQSRAGWSLHYLQVSEITMKSQMIVFWQKWADCRFKSSSTLILRNIFYLLSFHLRIYPGLAMFEGEGAGWGVQVAAWLRCSGARSFLFSCSLSPWLLGNPFPPPPSIAPSTTVHHQAWNWKYFCKNMEYFLHFKRCVVV